ncbi:hypothetical protein VP01_286g3 [Puccinia sorghi]|uniref:Phosphotransferase n=1 Tax=Puccinia sorghi TaxID=27349 RepID=A0A0L6V1W1_9BASI|nr:hypothetical protein VP01_286g3 [Puccinia sorghi]
MDHKHYLSPLDSESRNCLSEKQRAALAVLQGLLAYFHDTLRTSLMHSNQFDVDKDKLQKIVNQFQIEFKLGLEHILQIKQQSTTAADHEQQPHKNGATSQDVTLPMLPTFIHVSSLDVPNGDEKGLFLALDLGGTNLRVCEVTLNGDKTFTIKSDKYLLSDAIKTGTAEELFDYIADCVKTFLSQLGHVLSEDEKLHLGFTFSFPVLQSALAEGKLLDWTKGFKATGAVGVDIVKLLQNALDKKKVLVHCNALVNDTTGTLMARAYQSGSALVGAIFGTGTNAAYVERLSAVKKLSGYHSPSFEKADKMIINTEWGAFDNCVRLHSQVVYLCANVLPVTKYDNKLDRESINPRKQAFEKMVSGMYLGELTRNVLMDMIDEGLLFAGHSTEKLNKHYGFDTALMSQIDGGGMLSLKGKGREQHMRKVEGLIREQFGLTGGSVGGEADWIIIKRVCEIVATRAARLSAAAIATVIKQTEADSADDHKISIGVDGSLIERYANFMDRLKRGLRDLFDDNVYNKIHIDLAKDGSGVGAALCALQAKKQHDQLLLSSKVQNISF